MFGKHLRTTKLAGALATAALLVPVAQAGAQGQPRAMPSDYVTHLGQLPRAMPSDYGTLIQPSDYGMPRAMPADYEPVGSTTGGSGFDWADAGIGAGTMLALFLAAGAAILLRGGGRLEQA